jgi:hypothetical protein
MNEREKEIMWSLKILGYNFLFRNEFNQLMATPERPQYDRPFKEWYVIGEYYLDEFDNMFDFVKKGKGFQEIQKERN